ncbi:MAG: hypothetical protein ABL986_04510 [Vicinamibacterales bacterium]
MIQALVGLLLPIAAVWTAFRAARLGEAAHSRLLTLALASCVGIGASSALTFTTLMLGGRLDSGFVVGDALFWLAIGAVSLWVARGRAPFPAAAAFPEWTKSDRVLRGAFVVVFAMACAVPIIEYTIAPHGQWDAWAIWNQKARFMFRAGPQWVDSMAIPWSQPSHPPLVAASVARLWAYAGRELTTVPAMLSGAFAISMLTVVMGALDVRRSRAWVAGAILIAPLTFTHLASAQTADLPIGLFFIATLVMLPMRPPEWRNGFNTRASLLLAGATASLAAWTKNEGVVFFGASTALVVWSILRHGRVRDLAWWVAGATPFLAALVWFKFGVVPEGPDYLEGANTAGVILDRALDPVRLGVIADTLSTLAVRWGGPGALGSLLVVVGLAIGSALRPTARIARGFLVVSAVMVAAYSAVYLLTPYDVNWLMLTTFDRLILQQWPILVFAACAPADRAGTIS